MTARPSHPNRTERSDLSRRVFLAQGGIAAGLTILPSAGSVYAAQANDRVNLAMVGCGGRAGGLAPDFVKRGDCRVLYCCDPDLPRAEALAKTLTELQGGAAPQVTADFRRALEDREVHAVVSATPDHWHAPSTVWACQAGKDVYVEKPASHNAWEGRKMVEAARKYGRVVQIGTQNRSAPYNFEAKAYLASGKLGKIHFCRIFDQKYWGNFPPVPDGEPPAGLNWDIWNGPAPEARYNQNFHRNWHHFWRYSGGDIANDSSHQIDLARWLLGVTYPKTVYSVGGRFNEEGAAETPDTQIAVYEFDGLTVSFELTLYTPYMLKIDPEVRNNDMFPLWQHCATRIEIYGSEGVMFVGRHGGGWQVFVRPKDRQPVVAAQAYGRFPDPEHKENFIACIRSRNRPNADVEEGHISALWIHYANISYRLGGMRLTIDPRTEQVLQPAEAAPLWKRTYREPFVIPETV